jgi:ubiquinone/menaquinone biosynthesis C-methylase UbiE
MQRIKEEFLDKLETILPLQGKEVLEVGCGEGTRSIAIAKRCKKLAAVDPDAELIKKAQLENQSGNIAYEVASAEHLPFEKDMFDVVIFTLSLHHVPMDRMTNAIDEALRVVRADGFIVFLEPEFDGTLFESEIFFDAFDGDERKQKAFAYFTMLNHPKLREVSEIMDETIWKLDSVEDFIESMNPKRNIDQLKTFLEKNNYILRAARRINVFQHKQ